MESLALPWGEIARQFTKLMLSLLSHIGKHDAKAELNRRSQACEVLAGTGIRVAKFYMRRALSSAWSSGEEPAIILLMPTLLLTPRQTEDAQELWRACIRLGWPVQRLQGWKVPAVDSKEVAIYAEPILATRVAQTLGRNLVEPAIDFLPSLPESWRKRSVHLTTMKEARLIVEPRFIKSAAGKEFDARVYASGANLPRGELVSDSLPVLIQEIVAWDVEYRCFVSDQVVRTASSYWRYGKDPRNEDGSWCADELREATEFCNALLADPAVIIPEACVIDVGLIHGKGWAVIESNAVWSSGIYGCDATAVLPVLLRVCPPSK